MGSCELYGLVIEGGGGFFLPERNCQLPRVKSTVFIFRVREHTKSRLSLIFFKKSPSSPTTSPESNPDPLSVSSFEDIFHSVGGRRAWMGGDRRLTSPLVLADAFDRYPHWCRLKRRLDPANRLQSSYIQVSKAKKIPFCVLSLARAAKSPQMKCC